MATAIDMAEVRPEDRPRSVRARRRALIDDLLFPLFLGLVLIGTAPLQEWAFRGAIGEGDALNQVLHLCVFLLVLLGNGMPTRRELLCVPVGLLLLAGYCLLSVLWSAVPFISLRRAALTSIAIWMVFRLVAGLGPDHALKRVRQALALLLLINFLVVFLTPFGIHGEVFGEESSVVGNWRGIIPHKNIAGAVCAFTILLFVFDNQQFSRRLSLLVVAGAAVFLFETQSRTSEAILVLATVAGAAIRPYDANRRVAVGVAALILAAFALQLLSANIGLLSDILNDPGALTGRGAIWPLLLEYAAERPWTGTGFGAFWQIGDASPIWTLTSGWVAQYAAHGHNGYLDLLVTIGVPGLLLAVAVLVVAPLATLLLSTSIPKPRRSLLLAIIIFCAGHNLTESSLLNAASVVQVFLLLAIAIAYHPYGTDAAARLRPRAARAASYRARG